MSEKRGNIFQNTWTITSRNMRQNMQK